MPTFPPLATTPEVDELLAAGAPVAQGVSGGKDSCGLVLAATAHLDAVGHTGPRILIHADLGVTEWKDSLPTCERLARHAGLELVVVRRQAGDMMDRWEGRWANNVARYAALECVKLILPWSTPSMRFCTAELKRDVICRDLVRRFPGCRILSANGIRRDESRQRSQAPVTKPQPKLDSNKWRTSGLDWQPLVAWTKADVLGVCAARGFPLHEAYTTYGSSRVSCCFCLAGETEIVTRNGIRPIVDLAGGRHSLLVPKKTPYGSGLASHGAFVDVSVRSFGRQRLWRVVLRRSRRRTKVVYATAEHRWFVGLGGRRKAPPRRGSPGNGFHGGTTERATEQLQPGDVLRGLSAHPPTKTEMVPFAVAQGFVYGDGTKPSGDRPASLTVYSNQKDEAILPYFASHKMRTARAPHTGKTSTIIYGLPRLWKQSPDMRESRAFLLSWLAGYFAADGCVTASGTARLDSASLASLEIARGVSAVCGVGYGTIRQVERSGFGRPPTKLYSLILDALSLPAWFFVLPAHCRRVDARRAGPRSHLGEDWVVERVERTARTEEVYCAVVPDSHAFGLADGLMTGNCIMSTAADLRAAAGCADNHDVYRRMVALEAASTFAFQDAQWLGDVAPELLAPWLRDALGEAKHRAELRQTAEARIPKHLLYEAGWPRVVPTAAEAELLCHVRAEVARAVDLTIDYTEPARLTARYEELYELGRARRRAKGEAA